MSKTKTMRIAVIAAIMSLMLALSAWVALLPAHAAEEPTQEENTFTLSTGSIDGQLFMPMSPFVYMEGSEGESDTQGTEEERAFIVITYNDDTTSNPTHIRTEPKTGGLKLYGNFANVKKITVKKGFSLKNGAAVSSADKYASAEKKTYTLAGDKDIEFTPNDMGIFVTETTQEKTLDLGKVSVGNNNMSIMMLPFVKAGDALSEDLFNTAQLKSTVTLKEGGADKQPTNVRAQSGHAQGGSLQFYFGANLSNNKGDTITISKDFRFAGHDGIVYNFGNEDIVYTSMGGGAWYKGDEQKFEVESVRAQNQMLVKLNPFAHAGAPNSGETGITNNAAMKEYIVFKDSSGADVAWRSGVADPIRTEAASGGLKLYFDEAAVNSAAKGATLTIKAGFHYVDYNGLLYTVGDRDVTYIYDGKGTWSTPVYTQNVTITNKAEIQKLCVNQRIKIKTEIDDNAFEAPPTYSSSNTDVATVTKSGYITGVSEGTVTIKVQYAQAADEVTVTVGATPAITGHALEKIEDSFGVVKVDGEYMLRAYVNEELNLFETPSGNLREIVSRYVYENGLLCSKTEKVKKANVAMSVEDFDKAEKSPIIFTKAGKTSLKVKRVLNAGTETEQTFYADLPVMVYETETVEAISAARVNKWDNALMLYFADVVGGPESNFVKVLDYTASTYTTSGAIKELGNITKYQLHENMAVLRVPALMGEKTYKLSTIGHSSEKQCLLYFNGFNATEMNKLEIGAVLELRENFRFYHSQDGGWVAKYKFSQPLKFVWTGSEWKNYVSDTTDFTPAYETLTVPQYSYFAPEVTLAPPGSYIKVQYASASPEIVEVKDGKLLAKAAGSSEITAYIVSATEQGAKKFTVTVEEAQPTGVELSNNRTFYVAEGEKLDITKVRGKFICGTGSDGKTYYGEDIELTEENTQFTMPTATGTHSVEVTVTVTVGGKELSAKVNVNVDVQPNREIIIANFALWANGKNTVGIYFNGTFGNTANVFMKDLTPEQRATVVNFIEFERGGVKGAVLNSGDHTPNYLTHILVTSFTFNGQQISAFEQGDVITLKKGLTFYQWFGEKDAQNVPVGEGDYVKVGELKHDIKIKYNGDKFSWHIDPVSGAVKEETVTVGLGKTHASNVEITPVYATHGEWYFTVADSAIAKVSTSGLISGLKIGSTKVTATLKDVDGKVIDEVEFTVVVADVEKEIKITSEKPVNIALGAELDVAALAENFGLKGVVIMASGAEGEAVDLTKARVTGYDPEKNGKQTLTFRVSVNGVSVSGTFEITVGDGGGNGGGEEGCGCGSSVAGVASLAFGAAILAVAFAMILRRKKA
jgi:hypothetical protein